MYIHKTERHANALNQLISIKLRTLHFLYMYIAIIS